MFKYVFCFVKDFFVRKTNDVVSHPFQFFFSYRVVFMLTWFGMVTSVYLYDQTSDTGNEVNDVVSYDMLTEELHSQYPPSQMFPQHLLGKSGVVPVFPCIRL